MSFENIGKLLSQRNVHQIRSQRASSFTVNQCRNTFTVHMKKNVFYQMLIAVNIHNLYNLVSFTIIANINIFFNNKNTNRAMKNLINIHLHIKQLLTEIVSNHPVSTGRILAFCVAYLGF